MWKQLSAIPPVKALMTAFPYSVAPGVPIDEAHRMMDEHDIRHLPVMRDGELVGVVARHDLERADGSGATVGHVCRGPALVVDRNQPLDRVLARMAEEHADAALVVREGRLMGILTTTDICRALRDLLRARFPGGGDEAA